MQIRVRLKVFGFDPSVPTTSARRQKKTGFALSLKGLACDVGDIFFLPKLSLACTVKARKIGVVEIRLT